MTRDEGLVEALLPHVDADAEELLADVRRDAVAVARGRLVEAYAEALVRAATSRTPEAAPAGGRAPGPSVPHVGGGAAVADAAPPPAEPAPAEQGCYVYAVVEGRGAGAGTGRPGVVPGGPVEVVTVGGLSAVISAIDVEAMRLGAAAADISDQGWLAEAVRAHERAVQAAFHSAPTMRFGVVYPDRDAVAAMLREHAEKLRAELRRIAGTAEWNVKLVADVAGLRRRLAEAVVPAASSDAADDGAGRAYLERRRAARDLDTHVESVLRERADVLSRALAGATDVCVPIAAKSAGDGERVIFAAAYLVRRDADRLFTAAINAVLADLAARHVRVLVDGPLPPYHFTELRVGPDDG